MKQEIANQLLRQVVADYETMAVTGWDATRQSISAEMGEYRQYLQSGKRVLDVGCGNGRLLKLCADVNVIYCGIDNSPAMLALARQHFPERDFLLGSVLDLPVAADSYDAVFCLAVLHHIPSRKYRHQALCELARVAAKDGYVIMQTWHYRSPHFIWRWIGSIWHHLVKLGRHDVGDITVPWRETGVQRYVHLYTRSELIADCLSIGLRIVESHTSKPTRRGFRNLVVVAQKC